MNRGEIVELASFILASNDNQTNGTFQKSRIQYAVQKAYEREWRKFRQVATRSQIVMSHDFSWTGGESTLDMPAILQSRIIHSTYDITDAQGTIGVRTVFYVDQMSKQLRWPSPGGPNQTLLLRAFFLPKAEMLQQDASVPQLIQEEHHELLGWSAAVWLAEIANGDAAVPTNWSNKLLDLQTDYWKECSVAVLADRARIMPDDAENLYYLGAL